MGAADRQVPPDPGANRENGDVAIRRADPSGLIQRALGGFPTGFGCAEQVILAWLMTLPADLDPPSAAGSLLAGRTPCCREAQPAAAQAVRELLRLVASHRRQRGD